MTSQETLELGDIRLQSGEVLAKATITYATVGSLNPRRDNAIVMPTYYTGQHWNYASMIGKGKALDPDRYYIVIPNMFGNGLSSSPSTRSADASNIPFPRISLCDNVLHQARLVFDHLDVSEVAMVCGWSMGGMQAYQWASLFPERVKRLLPFCATARTSNYNLVFLKALEAALRTDCHWHDNRCLSVPEQGLRAFARVYVGWAYSEEFFRFGLYRQLGFPTVDALIESWERDHLGFDANDLMAMLDTWQCADISANEMYNGNIEQALRAIRAKTMLVPCDTDRYFSAADNEWEARFIPECEVRILDSGFGHCALSPGRVVHGMEFLDRCLADLLSRP
jgi:homoserine O-acetyltransferase/O-succinyltransferase